MARARVGRRRPRAPRARQRGSRRDVARRATERGEDQKKRRRAVRGVRGGRDGVRLFAVPKPARDSARVDGGFAAVRVREEGSRYSLDVRGEKRHLRTRLHTQTRHYSAPARDPARAVGVRPPARGDAPRVRRLVAPAFGGDAFERDGRVQRGFDAAYAELRAVRRARGAHAQRRGRRRLDPRHAARETPRVACHAGDAAPGVPRVKRPGVDAGGRRRQNNARRAQRRGGVRRASDTCVGFGRRSGHVRAYGCRDRGAARARAFAR